MPEAKTTLFVLLAVVGVVFLAVWIPALVRSLRTPSQRIAPNFLIFLWELTVGFVTDFFDTLGIGSFATTTSLYRAGRTIDDRLLPGTLNVGHTLPTILQACFFITAVEVETKTLVWMIIAAVLGSLLGAPIVARWPRRPVQLGMGMALIVLCAVLVFRQLSDPESLEHPGLSAVATFVRDHIGSTQGGTARGLAGGALAFAVCANFVLGALMTIGVGLYGPCLVLVSLLGMNPVAGFPIMMGSCAFLMPLASIPFIKNESYAPRAALGLALAGIPAVWIAAKWVVSLKLFWVQWLVAVVVIYTAITLLQAAAREKKKEAAA